MSPTSKVMGILRSISSLLFLFFNMVISSVTVDWKSYHEHSSVDTGRKENLREVLPLLGLIMNSTFFDTLRFGRTADLWVRLIHRPDSDTTFSVTQNVLF